MPTDERSQVQKDNMNNDTRIQGSEGTGSRAMTLNERYPLAAKISWNQRGFFIRIPPEHCSASDLSLLCDQVCTVLRAGCSVAVAVGEYIDTAAARQNFTYLEKAMYRDWENGMPMGDWDFAAHSGSEQLTGKNVGKFRNVASALGVLYRRDDITPEQAREWAMANPAIMPI